MTSGSVMRRIWADIDAGKTHHHCVVIDADGTRLLSRRVPNDEPELLGLLAEVAELGELDHPGSAGGSDTWKGEGLWHPRGSTPLSCGNARFGWFLMFVS
ncbi:IS110 family transposase, partial [Actinomadura soli]|uniref:IS110 family transposase n=1 Tax=Actinomadura soli TaxID=2508997 RepID=UPI00197B064E